MRPLGRRSVPAAVLNLLTASMTSIWASVSIHTPRPDTSSPMRFSTSSGTSTRAGAIPVEDDVLSGPDGLPNTAPIVFEGLTDWAPGYYSGLPGTALNDLLAGQPNRPSWQDERLGVTGCTDGVPQMVSGFYEDFGSIRPFVASWAQPSRGPRALSCKFEPGYPASSFWQYLADRYSSDVNHSNVNLAIQDWVKGHGDGEGYPPKVSLWDGVEAAVGDPVDEVMVDYMAAMHLLTASNTQPGLAGLNWDHPTSDPLRWRDALDASSNTHVQPDHLGEARAAHETITLRPDMAHSRTYGDHPDQAVGLQGGGATIYDIETQFPFTGWVHVSVDRPEDVVASLIAYETTGNPYVCSDAGSPRYGAFRVRVG